ncbi:hypothetical protein [Enterococcus sp. AD013-P3]|uniref:hypothetical protein n=1 Tax=Enterococcus sp. AD013-P3 TaxID=3411036 RepID=UPI003B935A2F
MIDSFARIYKVNSTSDLAENVTKVSSELKEYSKELIEENEVRKNNREYIYQSDLVRTKGLIDNLLNTISDDDKLEEMFIEICDALAENLLIAQRKFSERYPMVKLREGNIIFYLNSNGFLISKIDRSRYLNGVTYEREVGLPEEKPGQKIAYFQFLDNNEVSITLSDSNPNISTFWFDEFLELKPISDNEKNTKRAFMAIEGFINRQVTKISKADGVELRNNLIGYLRTNEVFSITEAKERIFGEYRPHNEEINMEKIKSSFEKSYIEKKPNFDTQFHISPDIIKAKMKKVYKIKENIELKTNGYIENLRDDIIAIRDDEGHFHLQILDVTSEVYESFKR